MEDLVGNITAMGFEEDQALRALEYAEGSMDGAIALLLQHEGQIPEDEDEDDEDDEERDDEDGPG